MKVVKINNNFMFTFCLSPRHMELLKEDVAIREFFLTEIRNSTEKKIKEAN